jgi:predicted  nucleic acid-binding Zn-ribbon protein
MELQLILARLRDAAELYRQLAAARRDADEGTRRQDSLSALDAEYADDLSSASTQRQQREHAAAGLEAELKGLEAKLRERRARPPADAHTQLALLRDIDALRERRDRIEQQLLDLWQSNSAADLADAEEAATVTGQRERLADQQLDVAQRAGRAGLALPEIEGELDHLLRQIPVRISGRLRKLADRLGDPVADLLQGSCGSCGYTMPPQDAVDADRDARLVVCQGCGRYVVPRSSRKTRNPG